jgi:hypothetical protein
MTNTSMEAERLIVSKQRVEDHGEVLTPRREVCAMLDLVAQETDRIDSRFLEQACGTGNFLVEVLTRKLNVVRQRYKKSQAEYEWNSIVAVSSIYGIDIQRDNVQTCRQRLLACAKSQCEMLFGSKIRTEWTQCIEYLLVKNIIWGDALTLLTLDDPPSPIVFSEWSPLRGGLIKRRDFSFEDIMPEEGMMFFGPLKEYPVTHFSQLANES